MLVHFATKQVTRGNVALGASVAHANRLLPPRHRIPCVMTHLKPCLFLTKVKPPLNAHDSLVLLRVHPRVR